MIDPKASGSADQAPWLDPLAHQQFSKIHLKNFNQSVIEASNKYGIGATGFERDEKRQVCWRHL